MFRILGTHLNRGPAWQCAASIAGARRSTWVLRRKYPPPLFPSRMSQLLVGPLWREDHDPGPLPEDHWYYEVVEEEMTRKPKEGEDELEDEFDPKAEPPEEQELRIILVQHVEDLGAAGSVVSVPASRARNELILLKKAVYASPFNLEWFSELIANSGLSAEAPSSALAASTKRTIGETCLGLEMSADQHWTVEKWHVRVALRKAGIFIENDDCVQLPQAPITGPNIEDLEERDFVAYIVINNREKAPIRCRIRHIGQPFSSEWNKGLRRAIFPEDEEILAKLPIEEETKRISAEESL